MPESRKSSRTIWIVAGVVIVGLVVLLAGPLSSVGNNSRTEPLFADTPDTDSLEALGSFSETADDAAASGTPGTEEAAANDGASAPPAADEETDSTDPIIGGNVSSFSAGDIFDLVWRLALVAGIVWASIFILRRYVGQKSKASSASGALKVLETVGLASNRLVYLLEAGDRVLVVGTTPNHIALLAELDDPEVIAALQSDADRTTPTVANLGDMMRNVGGRLGFMRTRALRGKEVRRDGADSAVRAATQAATQAAAQPLMPARTALGTPREAPTPTAAPTEGSLLARLRAAEQEIAASAGRLSEDDRSAPHGEEPV